MLIPRIIHQTFPDSSLLRPELLSNINCLKNNNPYWDYRLYDDKDITNFISGCYGREVLKRYNQINPVYGAARADLFRYLLMYHYGGVYLDIKSTITRPLDEAIKRDDEYLLSQWNNKQGERHGMWGIFPDLQHVPGGEFQQWHIIARPQHPFLKAVISNVLRNIDVYHANKNNVGQMGVLRTTGPIAYTLSIAPLLTKFQHRFVDIENELGFIYSIYESSQGTSHKSLFKNHYTTGAEPIVIGSSEPIHYPNITQGITMKKLSNILPLWRLTKLKEQYELKKQRKQYEDLSTQDAFTKIYAENAWGKSDDQGGKFHSGSGSHNEHIVNAYIKTIIKFLSSFENKPDVVDLGCGDFHIGSQIRHLCNNYIACDIVEPLIKFNKEKYQDLNVDFRVLDLTKDALPGGDIVFIRQVLQHLSNDLISNALPEITSKFKYLVLTEHIPAGNSFTHNLDKPVGPGIRLSSGSGIVLTSAPFNLKPKYEHCLCEVNEYGGVIKTMLYELF